LLIIRYCRHYLFAIRLLLEHSLKLRDAWSDGQPFTYTNWSPTEPNNAGGVEHDIAMNWYWGTSNPKQVLGQWNDANGDVPFRGLIELSAPPSALAPEASNAIMRGFAT